LYFFLSNNEADHNVLLAKGRYYTKTDCYALLIGDSAKKKTETIRFDETVCICVTMALLSLFGLYAGFLIQKN